MPRNETNTVANSLASILEQLDGSCQKSCLVFDGFINNNHAVSYKNMKQRLHQVTQL